MKHLKFLFFVLIVFYIIGCHSGFKKKAPVDYVNPFICSEGDHGHQHPGACVPWGMVVLGPDTYPSSLTGNGNWAHSGYNYSDSYVRGFSHIRIVGSGGTSIRDRENMVTLLPGTGNAEIKPEKRFTHIDKSTEKASPGIYSVELDSAQIKVDLSATAHTGFHKYTFPKTEQAFIFFKIGNARRKSGAFLEISNENEISGYDSDRLFFYIKIDKPFKTALTWKDTTLLKENKVTGGYIGAVFNFETKEDEVVQAKIGFSTVSIEDAKKNLEAEIPDWDFDLCTEQARAAWADRLGVVELEGNEEYKQIYYTHLYQSYITPCNITNVSKKYTGSDGKVHEAEDYTFYANYLFWDEYRTKYSLLSLTQPDVYKDIIRSLLDIYEKGFLTSPFLACNHQHMITVIADAQAKDCIDHSIEKAYPIMVDLISKKHFRRKGYAKNNLAELRNKFGEIGYIPTRPDYTLEYSYDCWCAAQLAKSIGKEQDAREYMRRSEFYKNVWDSTAPFWRGEAENIFGFFRARDENGEWLEFPHDPRVIDEKYVYEGSMWHWRWFVPHDVKGLIELVGGNEKFTKDLDYFFSHNLYQPGNQPDLQSPFMFNFAGAPWLTQKYVRRILTEPVTSYFGTHEFFDEPIHGRIFKATPDGYVREMDDDFGCMSGWYVLSAMGLYPVCVGDPVYQLTAPIFEKVTIYPDKKAHPEKTFTIIAKNLSAKNIYIQSATLNNQPYNKSQIAHKDIVKGGTLIFEMGDQPNKKWASQMTDIAGLTDSMEYEMVKKKLNYKMILLISCFCIGFAFAQAPHSDSQSQKNSVFNIMDFGAVPDGKTINTSAIQKAIQSAYENGGGTVFIPPGVFLSGSLKLFDNVVFYLEAGATILGSRDLKDYDENHLIVARNAKNITITGSGCINGQGDAFWESRTEEPEWMLGRAEYGYVPAFKFQAKKRPKSMIAFIGCSDVRLENIFLKNSPAWTVHFVACDFVNVKGVRIRNLVHGCNTDGLDIEACRDVLVSDCDIIAGDDAIVLKNKNTENLKRTCRNITVTNCLLATTCNGFKIGTETQADFENIIFTNSVIKRVEEFELQTEIAPEMITNEKPENLGPLGGVALETVDGCHVHNIVISNLVMDGVRAPIFIRLGNRGRGQTSEPTIPGKLSDILIENIIAKNASITSSITGLPNYPVENVTIKNVKITAAGGGTKKMTERTIPEEEKKGPDSIMFGPLPASGLFCRHVTGLELRDIQIPFDQKEERPLLWCDDVSDLVVENLKSNQYLFSDRFIHFNNVRNGQFFNSAYAANVKRLLKIDGPLSENIYIALYNWNKNQSTI